MGTLSDEPHIELWKTLEFIKTVRVQQEMKGLLAPIKKHHER